MIREVGVGQDRIDVAGRTGQRTGVGEQLLLGIRERMRGTPEDVAEIERIRLQPRLGGIDFVDGGLSDFQDSGSTNAASAPNFAKSCCISPAACPAGPTAACPGRRACWRRRTAATAPYRGATCIRARRRAPWVRRRACPGTPAVLGALLGPSRAPGRPCDRCPPGSINSVSDFRAVALLSGQHYRHRDHRYRKNGQSHGITLTHYLMARTQLRDGWPNLE